VHKLIDCDVRNISLVLASNATLNVSNTVIHLQFPEAPNFNVSFGKAIPTLGIFFNYDMI
jgi:hypothetical protein